VPFRSLMGDLSTVDALADAVDAHLPPEAPAPAAAPVAESAPAPLAAAPSAPIAESYAAQPGSAVERLIAQQLEVMSQQLQLLRGGAAPASAPAVNAPSSAAPPPAPLPAARNGNGEAFGPYRPATVQRSSTLDERQHRHLDALVERHVRRTARSRAMAESSRGPLADSRASAGFRMDTKELVYPIVGERSEGARLWDVDGNEYLDFTMGFGVHLFGHSPPFVTEALHEQIRRGLQLGPQSELAETVARMVAEQTGMDRVAFCNTGTEAIMGALRLARAHTRRERIAIFAGSYHGGSDGVLARLDASGETVPVAPGVAASAVRDVLVLDYGSPAALEAVRQHAGELAAVLVEPIQSSRPHLQPREFLHELRRITAEAGIALVFDEVISGFRLHPRGAQGWYGVDADIGAYGKVLGGGLPIGVVAGRREYMDAVDGGDWKFGDASYPRVPQTFFAGTFAKNPLVMAAARALLAEVAARGPALQEELNRRTQAVAARLNGVFQREGAPIQVLSGGSLFRFVHAPGERWLDLLYPHLLERGIYVWEGRACFLSTAHGDAEVDALVRAVEASVAALREGGFLPPRPEAEGPRRVPMTAAQQGIWVHTRFGQEVSLAYNEILALELEGELDAAALRSALERLVERHDSLRMTIDPDGVHQLRHPRVEVDLPLHDLSGGDAEGAMEAWFEGEVHRPLDLVGGPLFRTQLLRLHPGRHVLVLTLHHIIVDGAAAGVLLAELVALYSAAATGRDLALPPARQLSDFAVREREEEDTPRMKEAEAYWRAHLAGVPPLELGAGRSRPGAERSRGRRISATVDAEVAGAVARMAAERGTTLFTVLLSAYALVLHRLTGQDDFLVGAPADQRAPDEDRSLVAHAVDLVPVRCRVDPRAGYASFLRELTGHWHDALEHRHFTLGRWSLAGGDAPPRLATAINLEPPLRPSRGGGGAPAPGGVKLRVLPAPVLYSKLDINFDVTRRADGLNLICTYNTNLLDDDTARRVLEMLTRALAAVARDPERRISELELSPAGERERTLLEWNATETEFPRDLCLHQLVSQQARRAPDAPALLWGGETMTYGEVERRANQLAHYLRGRGVGPESRVALCLGRTPEMVVAILAVLRAGGAYVPLDPATRATAWPTCSMTAAPPSSWPRSATWMPFPWRKGSRWSPWSRCAATSPGSRRRTWGWRSIRAGWRTSSTPRAPPAAPRGSRWRTAAS
jgi:glutamate-1-semialdehyde aminotransferase